MPARSGPWMSAASAALSVAAAASEIRPRSVGRFMVVLPVGIREFAEDLLERVSPPFADVLEVGIVHIDADVRRESQFIALDDGQIQRGADGQVGADGGIHGDE